LTNHHRDQIITPATWTINIPGAWRTTIKRTATKAIDWNTIAPNIMMTKTDPGTTTALMTMTAHVTSTANNATKKVF
jgi:hypothetical protein